MSGGGGAEREKARKRGEGKEAIPETGFGLRRLWGIVHAV